MAAPALPDPSLGDRVVAAALRGLESSGVAPLVEIVRFARTHGD